MHGCCEHCVGVAVPSKDVPYHTMSNFPRLPAELHGKIAVFDGEWFTRIGPDQCLPKSVEKL